MKKNKFKFFTLVSFISILSLNSNMFISHADTQGKTHVIVSSDSEADMMVASPLSNHFNTKVILSSDNDFDSTDIDIKNDKIILIGGEDTLKLNSIDSYKYIRLSGKDRYETSMNVFEYRKSIDKVNTINIVSGKKAADAVTAANSSDPVVLTYEDLCECIDITNWINNQAKTLKNYNKRVIGGEKTISNELLKVLDATRIAGNNRYETNKKFIETLNKKEHLESFDSVFSENIRLANKAYLEGKALYIKDFRIKQNNDFLEIDKSEIETIKNISSLFHEISQMESNGLVDYNLDTSVYIDGQVYKINSDSYKYSENNPKRNNPIIRISKNQDIIIKKDSDIDRKIGTLFKHLLNIK
ncbi:cell wall-binding repeat-containing protein [Peptostreptococcus faecalis]|uniref:cell wall-binding repeat-containing protein n=1 Tax=Peptostreptococcus faecalis TaxID=2045015 RepID=UPI000C7B649B|nr:cell wall-binding repeat-containing protein [Peptostreptococcus faecalis]